MLTLLIAVSALLHVRAEYRGPRAQVYLFKPLTTTLILLLALLQAAGAGAHYRWLVVAGLAFSLAGDVFLMLPGDRFVPGLVSFLAAHLCYVVAFATRVEAPLALWPLLPLGLYGAVLLRVLLPHAGRLRVPVAIYALAILLMAWAALEGWADARTSASALAAAGALLFLASDSVLACNRFVRRFGAAQALILGTYFAAQWLIARSVA